MNTTSIIGLIVAVIVIGGGVWYFSSHSSTLPSTATSETGTAGDTSKGTGTFANLMALTGSVKCDVATAAGDTQSSGTVYVSNGQLRGDFNSTTKATGEKVIESHMIRAGGYMYTWSSMMPQGVKMSDAAVQQAQTGTKTENTGITPDTEVSYSCLPWTADAAQFTPPSNVSFMDMSGMMQGGVPSGTLPAQGTTYPQGSTKKPYPY